MVHKHKSATEANIYVYRMYKTFKVSKTNVECIITGFFYNIFTDLEASLNWRLLPNIFNILVSNTLFCSICHF